MKKLPIGISTFKEIREENYYYADKTGYVKKLVDEGKYYFISRPRRFGKSLFADTLKEAFSGNKDLFKGLYLEDNWGWSVSYPVIFLSFGGGVIKDREDLELKIDYLLKKNAKNESYEFKYQTVRENFSDLIEFLYGKYNKRVVVLVDEYDKPIFDNITDEAAAYEIREGLKNIYSVIKDSDAYIKFAFLTGVTKFSKVSLFSGINNLKDITLDKRFSEICGYTEEELYKVFADIIEGKDREEIKKWYNGYNFLGKSLYNPFDILLFLDSGEYSNYWFETATPGFLTDLLKQRNYYIPSFENIYAGDSLIGNFDIERIELETLLFQTGYLTIKNKRKLGALNQYNLGYPNFEVKTSLNDYILQYLTNEPKEAEYKKAKLYEALEENRIDSLKDIFLSFFSSIPNDWYRKNQIAGYEGYYASVFYCYFAALGLDVTPEDTTNKGRIDMTLKFEGLIYIFEFKVVDLVKENNSALSQIKAKKYYEKYVSESDEIYLVGVEFSSEDKNIVNFEWDRV